MYNKKEYLLKPFEDYFTLVLVKWCKTIKNDMLMFSKNENTRA